MPRQLPGIVQQAGVEALNTWKVGVFLCSYLIYSKQYLDNRATGTLANHSTVSVAKRLITFI
jgi:hypothetical protein